MRPSTPVSLSQSWVMVGADGTEQPQLPSPRPNPPAARPPADEDATSLDGSALSESHGELSLNPEDVEALSSAMLASMGGSAPGPAGPLPPVPPSPPQAEEGEKKKEEEEEGGVDAGSDGAEWLKNVASYLVRRLRSLAESIVATIQQHAPGVFPSGTAGNSTGSKRAAGAITPRRQQLVLAGGAAAVTVAMLAIVVRLCHASRDAATNDAVGRDALLGYVRGVNATTKTLAASAYLGRSLGCCRSDAEGMLLKVVHMDVASPVCVHVF